MRVAPFLSCALLYGAAGAQAHPHFDDHGTLTWFEHLADAKAAAKKADKLVFIEYGRQG